MSKTIQGFGNHVKESGFYSIGDGKPIECFTKRNNLIYVTDHIGCSVGKEWGESMW